MRQVTPTLRPQREIVIDWGGLPAWYLPNYWSDKTLKLTGPMLVNGLHAAQNAVSHLKVLTKALLEKNVPISVKYEHGCKRISLSRRWRTLLT
jgi:hypothetical protein